MNAHTRVWLIAIASTAVAISICSCSSTRPKKFVDGSADLIVVQKHAHIMRLFQHGRLLRTYQVALGRGGLGPKDHAGDDRVPEGRYRIVGRNPNSAFHRALRIGYPTPEQIRQAGARGVDPGGDIMIHGIRNGLGWIGPLQRKLDWTKGCIAVTNSEIDEIWQLVPNGTAVEITS